MLIERLDSIFKETIIYGLTSLARLVLLSEDTYKSTWHVMFASFDSTYYVDYHRQGREDIDLDTDICPKANNINDAVELVLNAMKNSGGWVENEELT